MEQLLNMVFKNHMSELQILLNALNDWCSLNDMTVNLSKSNIIHFRSNALQLTNIVFKCGENVLHIVDRYT